jgi:hypothetical protein
MKRGGSKMGYTEQFNLLSPCYKEGEQRASDFRIGGAKAKPTKKGKATKKGTNVKKSSTKKTKSKQKGGSSCGASMSVAEMGVVDKPPASLPKSYSQDAFLERYSNNIMKGGAVEKNVVSTNLKSVVNTMTMPVVNTMTMPVENTMTMPVENKNNSILNKSKNAILPKETISGLVIKVIKTDENPTNPTSDKFSYEIYYKIKGNNEIKKSVVSNVSFSEFFTGYRKISEEVFPRPPKLNNKSKPANAKANAKAKANANAKAKETATATAQVNNRSFLLGNNSNPTGPTNNYS